LLSALTLKQQQTHREVLSCAPYYGVVMNNVEKEVMLIAQEECAEVIQAISKVFRFGMDDIHPTTNKSNKESLEEEVGDLLCMIQLMMEKSIVDESKVHKASIQKRIKLEKWSNIFNEESEFIN
jgi:NTP pyrophosphatase (non-canonical NTP hydrolase)